MDTKEKFEVLIKHYAGGNKRDFSSKAGVPPTVIENIVGTRQGNPSFEVLQKILFAFADINPEWLLTGKGSMLKSDEKPDEVLRVDFGTDQSRLSKKRIPFYDINAEAGTIQVSNMDAVSEPDEWIDAGDWFLDADSAMRVHGDSMFPVYKSGSIVVMREVLDKTLIIFGHDYMIQTSEYRVIKRLQKSKKSGHYLACSINSETYEKGELAGCLIHEPIDISIDQVAKLYRVLGCVTRNEGSRLVTSKHPTPD